MSFAKIWMDLESVILNEVSQTDKKKNCKTSQMWNLKRNFANKLIYEIETDSQTQRRNLWLPGEMMGEEIGREFGWT